MPEVDVEQISRLCHHYVVVVPVPYPQDVRRYAVPGAGVHEILSRGLQIVRMRVLLLQPLQQHVVLESAQRHVRLFLDVAHRIRVLHHLDDALLESGRQTAVRDQVQVQSVLQPQVVHDLQHLQREHVLPQVVSVLHDQLDLRLGIVLVFVLELQPDRFLLRVHHLQQTGTNTVSHSNCTSKRVATLIFL